MNPVSDPQATRSSLSTVLAACIVAAGLIGAALIITHKPPATAIVSAKPATLPPITQESARDQIRAQVLASPKLHAWTYRKINYVLQDIQVKPDDVSYSAKDDAFEVSYHLVMQPMPPSGIDPEGNAIFTNDGYNHYSGGVSVDQVSGEPGNQVIVSDTVTIK